MEAVCEACKANSDTADFHSQNALILKSGQIASCLSGGGIRQVPVRLTIFVKKVSMDRRIFFLSPPPSGSWRVYGVEM